MKTVITFFFILFVLASYSKTWQVSNINSTADFDNLVLANSQALAGDTIYVEGSGTPYDGVTITKKLTLIGPGYFLTENYETHFNKKPALIKTNVVFEVGSSGSKLMGFDLKNHGADILIKESNIKILRNRLDWVIFNHREDATYNNIYISQNYIHGDIDENGVYNSNPLVINNLIISNNFINDITLSPQNTNLTLSALIENNVINYPIECFNSIIRNNIFTEYVNTSQSAYIFEKIRYNDVYNNVFTYNAPTDLTRFHTGTNNKWLINKSTLFVGLTSNSTDGQWQLRENSPGSEGGSDGTDCGMFGGATPYQLSGLPPFPVVYEIIGPDLETGKVTVKARAIK